MRHQLSVKVTTELPSTHHEHLTSGPEVEMSSDRTFGLVISFFLAVLSLAPLLHQGTVRWWLVGATLLVLAAALAAPRVLHPLNFLWAKLALLLHYVVSPIALALVFLLAFTTTGVLLRIFGKDLLRLRGKPGEDSYWLPRNPPGPAPETMVNQF